ncbi:MAG: hypothetical protein E7399_05830 [Ruminococcaceae bacterium]|nr:hypothetical protein [Oscillospiraceae bacterium]
MLNYEIYETAGVLPQDIPVIMEVDERYGEQIEAITKEYQKELCNHPFEAMGIDTLMAELKKTSEVVKTATALSEEHNYTIQLLFWLYLVPYMKENYRKHGIDMSIFQNTVKDISYKIEECKTVHGVVGVFTSWFFIEQELKLFALGRLQYDLRTYELEDYHWGDYTITKGDTVYSCHIPASGPLKEEDCMASFKQAYEFFGGAEKKGGILPIHCQSWLLYPPYIEKVYGENSNLKKFTNLFEMINQIDQGNHFNDCWRLFGQPYEGSSKGLPSDNSLRRNMIQYIDDYGVFGIGDGILLFDGETILNRK